MIERDQRRFLVIDQRLLIKILAAVGIGLLFGVLVVIPPYLPLPSDFQKLVWAIPFLFVLLVLFRNLEKLILFAIAISVPLNLDFSVIISPYARNWENIVRGYRTIIGLTELRISLVLIAVVIGYCIWLIKLVNKDSKRVQFFPTTTIPALGLLIFSLLSVIQAQDQQLWLFRVAQLVEVFLVYFYLANHIRTATEMRFFLVVSLGGLLVESALMVIQWITGLTFQVAGLEAVMYGPGRVGGTLGNPGPAGGYLSALVLIAIAMIWALPQRSQRLLAAASMGLGFIALVSTGSRIGWTGFAVTLLAFFLAGLRFRWIKRIILIPLFLTLLVLASVLYGTVYTRFTVDYDASINARLLMWKLAWNVIKSHPWLGIGAGNYALVTRDYYSLDILLPNEVLDIQVHNAYLNVWADSGIFALLCYLGLLGGAFNNAWKCASSRSRFVSLTGISLSMAVVSLCIQMVTGTFHMRSITLFVWLVIGLSTSLRQLEHVKYKPEVGS